VTGIALTVPRRPAVGAGRAALGAAAYATTAAEGQARFPDEAFACALEVAPAPN
jgi:hypothetical protein